MEAGGSKVLEAEQVKGTCRAQRGVKALREVYPVSGFLYITCKLCSYGIERYQQRCVTSSKKNPSFHCRLSTLHLWKSSSHVSHAGRVRDNVRQDMAPELIVPTVGVHRLTVAAIFAVASRDIAAIFTQPYVVVAVVLGTSKPAPNAVFQLVRGETTQLVES